MIKNFRARVMVDPRGKIKTGMKGKTKEGKEYPKSLDHFNLAKFPELREAYGEKPAALVVQFPSNEPIDFFDCNFEHWAKAKEQEQGTLIRRCDGETCLHRINETVAGKTYAAGEESKCVCIDLEDGKKDSAAARQRCKYTAYLKAWVVLPQTGKIENPLCYLFETHSRNSGDAIFSALNDVRVLTGGVLRGITFSLSVKMVGGKEDAKQKFPIWTLIPLGTVSSMRAAANRQLNETPATQLLPLLSKAPPNMIQDLLKASSMVLEGIKVEVGKASNIDTLTALKKQAELLESQGDLTEGDFEKAVEAMSLRYKALKGGA